MDLALSTAFVLFVLAIPVMFTGGVLLFLYASSTLAGGAKKALSVPQAATSSAGEPALAHSPQFAAPQGFHVVGFSDHHK